MKKANIPSDEKARLDIGGSYLLIAPKGPPEYGYYHTLTEHKFLVNNLYNFIKEYNLSPHLVTIYELREVNQ